MKRMVFVLAIVFLGLPYAVKGHFGALLLYLWVVYFRPDDWAQVGFISRMNLSFITGAYLLARCIMSGEKFRIDLRSTLLFLFLLITFVSTVQSRFEPRLMPLWIDLAKTLIIMYLLSTQITNAKQYRTVLLVIAFSLGIEAAKQGWVGLILHPGGHNDNILPQLGDNNGVAVGMLALLALFTALSNTAGSPREKWLCRFFIVGVAYRAISTYSRGAFLTSGALIIISVLRSKKKVQSLLGIALVSGVVLSVLPTSFWDRMSTIKVSEDQLEDDSSLSRLHFWRVAVLMANDHPLTGIGYRAYELAFDDYDFLKGRYGKSRAVHSMWFGVLAELGYPGLTVYVLLLLSSFFSAGLIARRSRQQKLPPEFYHYGVALQSALIAIFVGGSFVPWQYTEMLWHVIGLSMALSAVAKNAMVKEPAPVAFSPPASQLSTAFRPMPAARGMTQ